MSHLDISRITRAKSRIQNSLWNHDAYPDLPDLEPRGEVELAHFAGPGVVKTIHLTLNIDGGARQDLLRGVFLQVRYDGCGFASVNSPVGDFFCDSFESESIHFSSIVMAKRPTNSLFCYVPMPFEREIRVCLINKTDKKVTGYGYVTAESLPAWESDMAYFHANWKDQTVRLPDDVVPLLETTGAGHFFGCHLTAVSGCPHFAENQGICEGNDEFYIDGSAQPYDYLGTEDFFGFSWNWRELWYDDYSGTTFLSDDGGMTKLACYRFLLNDPVRFSEDLKAQINYRNEIKNPFLKRAKDEDNGDVRFGIVSYWYQSVPVDASST